MISAQTYKKLRNKLECPVQALTTKSNKCRATRVGWVGSEKTQKIDYNGKQSRLSLKNVNYAKISFIILSLAYHTNSNCPCFRGLDNKTFYSRN